MLRRRLFLVAALAGLPGCMRAAEPGPLARPIGLPALPPTAPLRLLGGLRVDTGQLGFGGLSGLHLAPDLTLTVISDLSRHAAMRLALDSDLRPTGLTLLRHGPLRDGAGHPLPRGHAGDAEALARLPDGTWLVAFERWHRIRAYGDLDGPGRYVEAPPGIERAPANGGLESLAVLADGRWIAMAEELPPGLDSSVTTGWIRGAAGGWRPFGYRPAPDHVPVDLAALPDGGVLVLERSFSLFRGFSGRLARLSAAQIADPRPGMAVQAATLLPLTAPLPTDNYEGLAVLDHDGRLLVAMISDDNENRLQETLLLLFELQR